MTGQQLPAAQALAAYLADAMCPPKCRAGAAPCDLCVAGGRAAAAALGTDLGARLVLRVVSADHESVEVMA